jgi:hypothetical protein
MELPWRRTTFIFDIAHRINWKARNEFLAEADYGIYFDGLYNAVDIGVDWEIPTGLNIFSFGELTYIPGITESFNYNPGNWDMYEWENLRKTVSTNLSQKLGFGRIDWIGNFRKGLEVSFRNSNTYNHTRNTWNIDNSLNATAHFLFTDFFGITSRLQFRHWFINFPHPLYRNAGDTLRGIPDASLWSDMMLSLNLEFPFRVLSAKPSDWFNSSKMRFFNFELFVSPILDMGLVHLPSPQNNQKTAEFHSTAGLELLVFPEFMRSFIIRFSYGIDLGSAFNTGKIIPPGGGEFFFGLYHFF